MNGKNEARPERSPVRDEPTKPHPALRGTTIAALTALRAGVGVIFVAHGAAKLADTAQTVTQFQQMGVPLPELAAYVALVCEFFGGLMLALGAFTEIAAIGPLIVMIGAIAFVHAGNGLFARNGGWEYPATLGLILLFFVTRGAGPVSVDALRRRTGERGERRAGARLARQEQVPT